MIVIYDKYLYHIYRFEGFGNELLHPLFRFYRQSTLVCRRRHQNKLKKINYKSQIKND